MIHQVCLVFALAFVVRCHATADIKAEFEKFISKHNRSYDAVEKVKRLAIFGANLKRIEEHTKRGVKAIGVNRFADWEPQEWHKLMMTSDLEANLPKANGTSPASKKSRQGRLRQKRQATPTSFDYRDYGWVTPVKNQGQCGACWSFAVAGAIESNYLAYDGLTLDLSEQQLIDCNTANSGCGGGVRRYALDYAIANGLTTESQYKYVSQNGPVNQACKAKTGAYNSVSYTVLAGEAAVPDYIYNNGPVTFGFQVPDSFQFYDGTSVFADTRCATGHYHAMVIMGYNANSWIVKNSWGTGFGDNGYVYYARNQNLCGIADRELEGVLY